MVLILGFVLLVLAVKYDLGLHLGFYFNFKFSPLPIFFIWSKFVVLILGLVLLVLAVKYDLGLCLGVISVD